MKKKRPLFAAYIVVLLLLGLLGGCGSNKNLEPTSNIVFRGADPASQNMPVDPPRSHNANFLFGIEISDSGLTLVDSDAWIIDRVTVRYALISDPGGHLLAIPADYSEKLHTKLKSSYSAKVAIRLVTDSFMADNTSGFIGTADTARIKVHLVFSAHRVKDGVHKSLATNYYFNIGDY